MLTEKDIRQLDHFDIPALEEGIRQVELSLTDSLNTQNSLDKKTFSLLTIFISFATVAVGIAASHLINMFMLVIGFSCSGICFLLASICLLISLWCNDYGALGRSPDTFLTKGFVQGETSYYGYTLAIILYQYKERIDKSDLLNNKRARWINRAIICGISAPVVSLMAILSKFFI